MDIQSKQLNRCECGRGHFTNEYNMCMRCIRKLFNTSNKEIMKFYRITKSSETCVLVNKKKQEIYEYLLAVDK